MHKAVMSRITLCVSILLLGLSAHGAEPPRLILQITVDQLRGDLLERYADRFGQGGFRYLQESGTQYLYAHHAHANNETVVGHATLATGAHPAQHGMIANLWFDRESSMVTYNIEDADYRLLSADSDVDTDTEIDPTQRAARSEGRSPRAMLVSTFSDQLALNAAGEAKVFGVSVKDRGAVTMAGHAGKAFWFSKASGEFVTSTYYYDKYPQWVANFNANKPAQAYANRSWELLQDRSTYTFGARDDQAWETDLAGYGRKFPHSYGAGDGRYFTTLLTISPAGDQMVLDFAQRLVKAEALGKDNIPDYLSVSLSATDYIGHLFGPSSLEAEDNLLRLDAALAEFLAYIDKQVGLKRTLIVLSADHGAPEVPAYNQEFGLDAGYVDTDSWAREAAIAELEAKFGIGESLIERYAHPYVYLNRTVIAKAGIKLEEVQIAVAGALSEFAGVHTAVPSAHLESDEVPQTPVYTAVKNNFNPQRSGDVYVVFKPNWFINDFDGLKVASTHGSPWRYDSHVPLIFTGPGIAKQKVTRRVHTIDVAPTLSVLSGVGIPSGAVGEPLKEAGKK